MRSPAARSPWAKPNFCPECGVEDSLDSDDYRSDSSSEFICRVCHIGFRLEPSLRYQKAIALIREHTKQRMPNDQVPKLRDHD